MNILPLRPHPSPAKKLLIPDCSPDIEGGESEYGRINLGVRCTEISPLSLFEFPKSMYSQNNGLSLSIFQERESPLFIL